MMKLRGVVAALARSRTLLAVGAAIAVLLLGAQAWARVGGGDSYSGGGGGYSGGGGGYSGGGDSFGSGGTASDGGAAGELLGLLLWLMIEHPAIGIPAAIVIGFVWLKGKTRKNSGEWSTSASQAQRVWQPPVPKTGVGRRELEGLRRVDPAFSVVVFEDFLCALYARAHELRGEGAIDLIAPYLSVPARKSLFRQPGLTRVANIVVGGMKILSVRGLEPNSPAVRVSVSFEANFTEFVEGGGVHDERVVYSVERWELARKSGLPSKPPEKARKIGCPSCGAALTEIRGSTCSFCGKVVDTGEFDWTVQSIVVAAREDRGPQLLGGAAEVGTDLPTVVAPDAEERLKALGERDPEFDFAAFRARVLMIFGELQAAWSEREWMRVRPFVTDNLFQMQLYWIESFRRQRVRNIVANPQVSRIQLAAVMNDAWFDSITVRVFASCFDYYMDEDGGHLGGSRSSRRVFTEYWTFVRGSSKHGRSQSEPKCPNCGAPLKINQAGSCEFCQAKVTSGDFDWVLSRIEQDESYRG